MEDDRSTGQCAETPCRIPHSFRVYYRRLHLAHIAYRVPSATRTTAARTTARTAQTQSPQSDRCRTAVPAKPAWPAPTDARMQACGTASRGSVAGWVCSAGGRRNAATVLARCLQALQAEAGAREVGVHDAKFGLIQLAVACIQSLLAARVTTGCWWLRVAFKGRRASDRPHRNVSNILARAGSAAPAQGRHEADRCRRSSARGQRTRRDSDLRIHSTQLQSSTPLRQGIHNESVPAEPCANHVSSTAESMESTPRS